MRIIAVSAALLVLATSTLSAQRLVENRSPRHGFWIGLGLGAGSAGFGCSSCASSRTAGPSGYFRLGGTLSQQVLLGGETSGWRHSGNGANYAIAVTSAVVLWYPDRTGAFYLKLGLGALQYHADVGWTTSTFLHVSEVLGMGYHESPVKAKAACGSLGLGYELRVSRNMSINAFVNGLASTAAKLEFAEASQPSSQHIKLNLVQAGVGVTWH